MKRIPGNAQQINYKGDPTRRQGLLPSYYQLKQILWKMEWEITLFRLLCQIIRKVLDSGQTEVRFLCRFSDAARVSADVLSEPDVEGVFINIFGGTTRCDIIAEGLASAAKEINVGIPIVVRI
ncbi:MAG: hypothetical protein J6P36_05455, partial [Lachnospiraceae bacterium]|nr:hypothetical protein [Lachnospiraceae bacterium]